MGDPEVREALDQVIEKRDAIAAAQAELDETGRQWFDRQLRAELERRGNLPRLEASLLGSGAIAQDGGVAAGEGAVAIGNVSATSTTASGWLRIQDSTSRVPAGTVSLMNEEMVIFTRTLDLLTWLLPATNNFPRHIATPTRK